MKSLELSMSNEETPQVEVEAVTFDFEQFFDSMVKDLNGALNDVLTDIDAHAQTHLSYEVGRNGNEVALLIRVVDLSLN